MSAGPASNTFDGATPIFCVKNVPVSVEYYVNVLGFKVDWQSGYPGSAPGFASVSRGRCHIFLCEQDQGNPGAWTWIGVTDTDSLEAEFRPKGAKIRNPPTNYPWAYEMQVEDPDGNVLRFGAEPKKDQPFGLFRDMHGRLWPPYGTA